MRGMLAGYMVFAGAPRGLTRDTRQAGIRDRPGRWAYGNKAHEHGRPGAQNLRPIDRSELAPQFASYYASGERIRVRFHYGEELTGTVGKTIGWRPVYMLMRTARSIGSSDLLRATDQVIAVKHGRAYRPIYQEVQL